MSNTQAEWNPGSAVKVDITAIERELSSLWKSAADAGHGDIIRACSCNLLAIVQNSRHSDRFFPVLARVSEWHPSRTIIACVEPDEAITLPDDMHAWISAQCSTPLSGGPQVCCEAITVRAGSRARKNLPNTILALLVPDLPVYLYWRSFNIGDKDILAQMAGFSHLLIVDSHQSSRNPQERLQILQLLIDQPAGIAMRDLNWARITPWRDLIAQFFDSTATRHYVDEINEIEISRNLSAPGSIPTRTLLLTGWLASNLGWRRMSAERSGDRWFSRWTSNGREIMVHFTGVVSRPGQAPGISTVTLRTHSGAEFSVFIEEGSHCLSSIASIGGSRLAHSVPEEPMDEASLLINELSQTGADEAFKAALAEAYELEEAFRENRSLP